MTTSEAARHVRAEIETIASGLPLHDLARLLEYSRRLCERDAADLAAGAGSSPSAFSSRP